MDMFSAITRVNYEERSNNHEFVHGATKVATKYIRMEQADEAFANEAREEKIRLEQTKKLGFETSLISDLDGVLRWEYEDNDGVVHGTRLTITHVMLGEEIRVY